MSAKLPFAGRHALVTGGASGIGAGIARRLVAEGATVVLADVNDTLGVALAEEIGAEYTHLDVADAAAWALVVAEYGPFSLGFLNAGVTTHGGIAPIDPDAVPLADLSDEAYRRIVAINLDGVVFGARALIPGMCAAGAGDIIVTASIAGLVGTAFDPMYAATKHAVVGFVKSIAPLLEPHGVCASSINPGFVDTPILGENGAAEVSQLGLPLLRPADIGTVAVQALTERLAGAQWVVWGEPPATPYTWADPLGGFVLPSDLPNGLPNDLAASDG